MIVPAYNAAATIGRTLEALSRQNCFQPYEVIVIDDGSSDETPEVVRSFALVKYARQDNAGPAAARNHGARLARGGYLAFTDSDCLPHEDWISQLMAGFSQSHVGAVAGSYGIANPESQLARCIDKEIRWRHRHLMPEFPQSFGSYNVCIQKKVFEAVGGFNTGYRLASGEDNDLSYKVIAAGWRIFFQRRALVNHFHTARVCKYLKEQFRHGFWRVKMYQDHPQMMQGDDYTFWKDMLELPWSAACLLCLALSPLGLMGLSAAALPLLLFFLIFEIIAALWMMQNFFDAIFFGMVSWLRAFARMLGFSTGILTFWAKKT